MGSAAIIYCEHLNYEQVLDIRQDVLPASMVSMKFSTITLSNLGQIVHFKVELWAAVETFNFDQASRIAPRA
jgi:hypothetical protein